LTVVVWSRHVAQIRLHSGFEHEAPAEWQAGQEPEKGQRADQRQDDRDGDTTVARHRSR
jgi:hypothetical protein